MEDVVEKGIVLFKMKPIFSMLSSTPSLRNLLGNSNVMKKITALHANPELMRQTGYRDDPNVQRIVQVLGQGYQRPAVVGQFVSPEATAPSAPDNASISVLIRNHGSVGQIEGLIAKNPLVLYEGDQQGFTPLHLAAFANRADLINTFVTSGAIIDERSRYGKTPLMCAAEAGSVAAVNALLAHGSDPEMQDDQRRNAIEFALEGGHELICETILNYAVLAGNPTEESDQTKINILKKSLDNMNVTSGDSVFVPGDVVLAQTVGENESLKQKIRTLESQIRAFEKQIVRLEEISFCAICLDKPTNAVCIPCYHHTLCIDCALIIEKGRGTCPSCDKALSAVKKTY